MLRALTSLAKQQESFKILPLFSKSILPISKFNFSVKRNIKNIRANSYDILKRMNKKDYFTKKYCFEVCLIGETGKSLYVDIAESLGQTYLGKPSEIAMTQTLAAEKYSL